MSLSFLTFNMATHRLQKVNLVPVMNDAQRRYVEIKQMQTCVSSGSNLAISITTSTARMSWCQLSKNLSFG